MTTLTIVTVNGQPFNGTPIPVASDTMTVTLQVSQFAQGKSVTFRLVRKDSQQPPIPQTKTLTGLTATYTLDNLSLTSQKEYVLFAELADAEPESYSGIVSVNVSL